MELPDEWLPDRRLRPWCDECEWLDVVDVWRLFRCLRVASSAGRPWTIPLRASMPPLTLKFLQTMKARMAAFSRASSSVW